MLTLARRCTCSSDNAPCSSPTHRWPPFKQRSPRVRASCRRRLGQGADQTLHQRTGVFSIAPRKLSIPSCHAVNESLGGIMSCSIRQGADGCTLRRRGLSREVQYRGSRLRISSSSSASGAAAVVSAGPFAVHLVESSPHLAALHSDDPPGSSWHEEIARDHPANPAAQLVRCASTQIQQAIGDARWDAMSERGTAVPGSPRFAPRLSAL